MCSYKSGTPINLDAFVTYKIDVDLQSSKQLSLFICSTTVTECSDVCFSDKYIIFKILTMPAIVGSKNFGMWGYHPKELLLKTLMLRHLYRKDVKKSCMIIIRQWKISGIACSSVKIRKSWLISHLEEGETSSLLLHHIIVKF